MKETQVIDALHDLLQRLRRRNAYLEEELRDTLNDERRVIVSFAENDAWFEDVSWG